MTRLTELAGSHWRDAWVIHRDAHVLVIDKPAAVASHPVDALELADVGLRLERWLGRRPSILHALDREASGVMVLALDSEASRGLAGQFERGVAKRHLVGVTARPRGLRHEVVAKVADRLIVRVDDHRNLRRVFAEGGAPIAGDRDNGGSPAARLMWHVEHLALAHPISKVPLPARAPMPASLQRWLDGSAASTELGARLTAAAELRYALVTREGTNAFRLLNGAGDEVPGVEVDVYGEHAVVSLSTDEAIALREAHFDAVYALGFQGVYAKLRPKQANTLVDTRRENVAPPSPVRGEPLGAPAFVRELGIEYAVRLGDGLSTGIFLDQRAARRWLHGAGAEKSVLNLFAYHGAFTVAAIAGGARRTVTVDASGVALERARENLEHHGVASGSAHAVVRADAASWLASCRERFDVVVLDPPSFSTTKHGTFRAERDYQALAALAVGVLAPQGALLASTNLRRMTPEAFRRMLAAAARDAGRDVAKLRSLPLPHDHPPAPGEPWHLKSELLTLGN